MKTSKQFDSDSIFLNNISLLEKNLNSERPHHSWLVYGNKGIGKSTLILQFIKKFFFDTSNLNIEATALKEAYYHPDLLIINNTYNKKDISIDDIRQINDFLHLTPFKAKFRVVLIDDCNNLSNNAANALLKILEEPPKNALLFLISHNIGKLPPTILSRCLKLRFSNPSIEHASNVLLSLIPKIEAEQANKLLILSHASLGIAIELYNHNAMDTYQLFLQLVNSQHDFTLKAVWQWLEAEDKQWQIISILINRFVSTLIKTAAKIDKIYYISNFEQEIINQYTDRFFIGSLIELYDDIQKLLQECTISNLDNKQIILTIFSKLRSIP